MTDWLSNLNPVFDQDATEPRNRTIAATERLPIVPAPGTGVVTASCGDRDYRYPVAQHVGRMLRIGSEVRLCFTCGPEGGVYHPDDEHSMEDVRAVAESIFLHDGDGSEPPTAAELRAFDMDMRRFMGMHE